MPFAQGSRTRLSVSQETSFGVLPSSPQFTEIPFKTHSLSLTKERVQGEDIRSNRMLAIDRHGNRSAGGSIEVDMRRGDYDIFLESVMFNTFDTSDELVIGTTPRFISIEDAALDITQFQHYQGMAVNTASFSIAPNQMVQTTFEMVGKDMVQSGTAQDATVTAPQGFEPFDSYNGALFEGGTGTGDLICNISALDFSITNSLAPVYSIMCAANNSSAAQLEYGMAMVEGTLTAYYEDATLINKFLNETETSLSITLDDPTQSNGYTFIMPRVKYNGANTPVANPQSRFIEIPFVALYDEGTATMLRIIRTSGT